MTIRNPYAKKRPRTDSCSVNTTTNTSGVAPPPRIANVNDVIQQQPPRNTAFKPPVPSTGAAGGVNRQGGSVSTYSTKPVRQNSTHNNSNSLGNVYRPSNNVVPSNSNVYRPSTSLTGAVCKERETCYDRSSHAKESWTAVSTSYGNSNHHPMPNDETLPNSYPQPRQHIQKHTTTTLTQNPDAISQTISSNMVSSSSSNSRAVSTTRNPYSQSTAATTSTDTSKDSVTTSLENSVMNCNPYPTTSNKVPKVGSSTTTSRNSYAKTTASTTTILAGPSSAATLPTPAVTHTSRPPSPTNPYAKSMSASGATSDSNRNPHANTASTTDILAGPSGAAPLPKRYPPPQQVLKPTSTTLTQNPDATSQTIPSNMASSSSNSRAASTTRNPYPQSTAATTSTKTSKDSVTASLRNSMVNCNPYPTTSNKVPKVGSTTFTSRNPYVNTIASTTTILAGPSSAATLPTPAVTHTTRPPSAMNPYAKAMSASRATLNSNRNPYANTASTTTILAGPMPNDEILPNSYAPPQQVLKPTSTTLTQNPDATSQAIPSSMASSSPSSNSRAVSTTRNPYPQSTAASTSTDTSKASSVTAPLGKSVIKCNPYPTTLYKVQKGGSSTATGSRNPYADTAASTTTILAATLPTPAVIHTRPPSPMNPYAESMSASGATSDSNRNPYAKTSAQPCTPTHNLTQPGTSRPPSPMNPYLKSLPGASQTLPYTGSGNSVPSSPVNPYRKSVPTQSQATTTGAVGNPTSKSSYRSSSRDAQSIKLTTSHSSLGERPPLPTTTDHNIISQQAIVGQASGTIQPQSSNQNAFVAAASRSVVTASSNSFMETGPTASNPVVVPVGTEAATQLPVNQIPGRCSASAAHSLASLRPAHWGNNAPLSKTQAGEAPLASKAGLELPGEPTLPKELQYSPDSVKPVEDEYRQELVKHANLSAPLLNGWTLFSHQKRAILKGLLMRRVVMALDMGLGKTLIGCVWSKAFKKTYDCLKIFVVCPVSLKTEWQRTAENATGLQVEDDSTPKAAKANKSSLDMKICSWAKVVTDVQRSIGHYVVVCDEAHSMQSIQASRTKDVLKLVKGERCVGVLLLTGTPMKNGKPCNLFPLLKAVRHPFGNNQKEYERHFCAGAEKNFGRGRPVWDASGSSNLKQLKRLVASHLLHLTKAQCLAELPPLTRETRKVPVSSRCQLQYIQALKSLANVHAQAATREDDNESVLGAVQKLRVTCSHAKVGATVELAIKLLEHEPALVLFTSFAQVAKQVHQQLAASGWEGELLTGETPPKKRQGMVDNFQEGLSPVFVCTYGAGGVGLTLTAASTIILLDRPWTPGDTRQAEDRVRRIGQTKAVTAIWMSAFDMDIQVDQMLESKTQTSDAVLADGHSPTGYGAKISIPKLLQCLMAKVS